MLVKKGNFYHYFLENEEITLDIKSWISPFGIEIFGKKTIINIIVPENNEGLNLKNILKQIGEEVFKEYDTLLTYPLKKKNFNSLLRCETKKNIVLEKNDSISGKLRFKIYNFRGDFGVSVLLE